MSVVDGWLWKLEAAGSNPATPTSYIDGVWCNWLAQKPLKLLIQVRVLLPLPNLYIYLRVLSVVDGWFWKLEAVGSNPTSQTKLMGYGVMETQLPLKLLPQVRFLLSLPNICLITPIGSLADRLFWEQDQGGSIPSLETRL